MTTATHCAVCLGPLPWRPWWARWFPPLPVHTGAQVPACITRKRRLVGAW